LLVPISSARLRPRQAQQIVRTAEPSMAVECYFADFDGMYRVIEAGLDRGAAS
jgi:hypothetical protein